MWMEPASHGREQSVYWATAADEEFAVRFIWRSHSLHHQWIDYCRVCNGRDERKTQRTEVSGHVGTFLISELRKLGHRSVLLASFNTRTRYSTVEGYNKETWIYINVKTPRMKIVFYCKHFYSLIHFNHIVLHHCVMRITIAILQYLLSSWWFWPVGIYTVA